MEPETLRKWEMRYGFPAPWRSEAGNRLYSEEDIEKLRLIQRALSAGHRPSEVVTRGRDEIEQMLAMESRDEDLPTAVAPSTSRAPASTEAVLRSLRDDDLDGVRSALRNMALLLGPLRFVIEFAHPLAIRTGELWAKGELEIRHEHVLTEALSTQVRMLRSTFDDARGGPVVVLAAPPDEAHGLALEFAALVLSTYGALPRVLGANTPVDQIAGGARAFRADAVGLSIMPSYPMSRAEKEVADLARALPDNVALWLGGGGAARLLRVPKGALVIRDWGDIARALAKLGKRK